MLGSKVSNTVSAFSMAAVLALLIAAPSTVAEARVVREKSSGLGIVKGSVRDTNGRPIIGAIISIFRSGSLELFKQVKSSGDGSFATRLLPGKYTIIAAASGFDSASYSSEVGRSSQLVYKFNLQPTGFGKTVPERKIDRKGSMWVIRGSQIKRSIFQHTEGDSNVADKSQEPTDADDADSVRFKRRAQSVVESYGGSFAGNSFTGVNFASLQPLSDKTEIIIAGQYGSGRAPARIEAELNFRANPNHKIRIGSSLAQFSGATLNRESHLAQFSFQATDEWKVGKGVIIVLGVDYSRFLGRGNDSVVSPRIGLQLEADSKTRIRGSYTSETEQKTWQSGIDLEGAQIFFREPVSIQDVYISNGNPVMNRSGRLEFGVERIIDRRSSLEANVFVDLTLSRGVGLTNIPLEFVGNGTPSFVANQSGQTRGLRVVYARRLNGRFSTSAGYAFGSGQRLNPLAETPEKLFEGSTFNTFFGQLTADVLSGTNVRTVFRLSPQATVFAIDPFKGRLAIYDPSLSVIVTQILPSMGLPIRAEAVIDARNLLDYQTSANGDEGTFTLLSQRRMLRGGIKVRF